MALRKSAVITPDHCRMSERLSQISKPSPDTPCPSDSSLMDLDSTDETLPIQTVLAPPSMLARYSCASILMAVVAVWGHLTFIEEDLVPGGKSELHCWRVPLFATGVYLISLPLLRTISKHFLQHNVDAKVLLKEAMVLYNAIQVILNGWMVIRILDALLFRNHPFIGGPVRLVDTGASYAVWVHYCDKYLEFLDTYFMVLRGKMDQVSFLHVYHHTSISWAWWFALKLYPGGDVYFGALLNSWIHVMMYSYYTLSLLKIQCPWKKYLTQAQLLQFLSVLAYSAASLKQLPQEEGNWAQYLAYGIQVFEMSSMFLLFLHFYWKAYSNSKRKTLSSSHHDVSSASSASSTDSEGSGSDVVAEQESVSSSSSDEQGNIDSDETCCS